MNISNLLLASLLMRFLQIGIGPCATCGRSSQVAWTMPWASLNVLLAPSLTSSLYDHSHLQNIKVLA